MHEVDQIFNDASMIAEMTIRDQLSKAVADKELYMAICYALLKQRPGRVEIMQDELLANATVYMSLSEAKDSFQIWIEEDEVVEEVDVVSE